MAKDVEHQSRNWPVALATGFAIIGIAWWASQPEPRYEHFEVPGSASQVIRGIFDTVTGQVCYAIMWRRVEEMPANENQMFIRCAPEATEGAGVWVARGGGR